VRPGEAVSPEELSRKVSLLISILSLRGKGDLEGGLQASPPEISVALARLEAEGLVDRREGRGGALLAAASRKRHELDYYKNNAMHRLVAPGLLASAVPADGGVTLAELRERLLFFSRLLKYEVVYRTDARFDTIVTELVSGFVESGWISLAGGQARATDAGRPALQLGRAIVQNYLEAYAVAASGAAASLSRPRPGLPSLSELMHAGDKALSDGRIVYPESVSKSLYENATSFLREQRLAQDHAAPETRELSAALGEEAGTLPGEARSGADGSPTGRAGQLADRIWNALR
jgi:glycerol-3-phosphate O-acyltransferase